MVPPTKTPFGPMTRDICYSFQMTPNCAMGTSSQATRAARPHPPGRDF
ncbi:rCG46112 [Rattus norvegicus]|uniref:RCG46112 n=1 Tax=Rattus norvegicus TaxID=10116 RepID=A6ICX5_RAT|nr:rCG46112 [Rattus norvegicus]